MDLVVVQSRPEARSPWGTGRGSPTECGQEKGTAAEISSADALRWLLIRREANGTLTGKERTANERPRSPDVLQ